MIHDRDIRFMKHERVHDALALGWMVIAPAFWSHHDDYSVPMVWLCACTAPVPKREHA